MIEATTIRSAKTDCNNQIHADRNKGNLAFQSQPFQAAANKNPCHDGCNVTEKQLQTGKGETTAIDKNDNNNEQSSGIEKTSGGNCPGSGLIANILQDLIQALESSRT